MRGAVVVSGVVAALMGLGFAVSSASPRSHDDEPRVAFTITNATSSSPTTLIPAALFPGVTRYLWYSVRNRTDHRIEVTDIHIASTSAPMGCPASELDLSRTDFTGALLLGPRATDTAVVPFSLIDTGGNQDACEGRTFYFHFSGSSISLVPARTEVSIDSSSDPSFVGQSVTFTASVTLESGRDGAVQGALAGFVTFFDGGAPICAAVPVVAATPSTATASCSSPVYTNPGEHDVTAQFSSSSNDTMGSGSRTLIQVVLASTEHCRSTGRPDHDGDCDGSRR